ncbi:MAG TPA: tetratricopeptide repeat protein [Candidatus Melainabacteria bacterium]|nr:tetratricopeptide repeat protein [Candidatus Melainabacteria bacterium]
MAKGKILLALSLSAAFSMPLAFAQAPGSGTNQQAISMYNLGLNAYKQGSTEAAIIFFRRACDIDPNLPDAQYNLGMLYQSQKRLKEAVPRFQEVLRVKPQDPDAHYQLAICLMDLGRGAEARPHLAAIPPSNPHFADAQKRSSSLGEAAPLNNDLPLAGMNPPPVATQPVQQPQQQAYAPAAQAQQPAYSPPAYSPPAYAPPAYSPPAQTQVQEPATRYVPAQPTYAAQQPAVAAVPPAAPVRTATNPSPVLANSTVRVIATNFNAPSGLAFDRTGHLYIANFATNSIDRISPDGSRSVFSSGANFKGPIGVTVDDQNNVYVANYSSGTIARINPAGISTIIGTGFKSPYYLTLDRDGNLYVSQQDDNSVVRMSLPKPAQASASRQ